MLYFSSQERCVRLYVYYVKIIYIHISAKIRGEKKCLSVNASDSGDHRPVPWCFEV